MQERLTLGELQRNAANILGFLLKSPSILLLTDRICAEELEAMNTKEAGRCGCRRVWSAIDQ